MPIYQSVEFDAAIARANAQVDAWSEGTGFTVRAPGCESRYVLRWVM